MAGFAPILWRLAHHLYSDEPLVQKGALDRVFVALQEEGIVRVSVEVTSLDSTSVKVHPDGAGALKKASCKPLANPGAAGTSKFVWLPQMSAMR